MIYEFIEPQDWDKIIGPIYAELGHPLPQHELARFAVARDGDTALGFMGVQLKLHMGPIWNRPLRGVDLRRLWHLQHATLNAGTLYHALPETEEAERACRLGGMKQFDRPAYWRTV